MANEQNNSQSAPAADNATAASAVLPLAAELGPNGLPVNPPDGEAPEKQDASFILDTFFGDGQKEPPASKQNSASGQGKGSKGADGLNEQGPLASPAAEPAANGDEGSPQPGPSSTAQQPQKQVGEEGGAAQTPGQPQGSPESQPAAPQLSAEDRLKLASADALVRQNAALLERLRAFESGKTQSQPQGGQSAPAGTQPDGGQEPPLRLSVPNDLYGVLVGDDPQAAKQGMDLLITAVAQNAVNAALAKVGPMIDAKMAEVTNAIQAGESVNKMEEAYYGRFPSHQNPLYRQLIQSVVEDKYRQFPHAQWDETMMDAVGATVNQKLKELGIDPSAMNGSQQQAGNEGQGQQQQRPKPAPMLDGSTRAAEKVPNDAGEFMRATFG